MDAKTNRGVGDAAAERLRIKGNTDPDSDTGGTAQASSRDALPVTVAEFQKNARGEVVRIALESFKGSPLIAIRIWYRDGSGGLRPGRDGLNIAIRHVPALAAGIAAAEARARALGLLDG